MPSIRPDITKYISQAEYDDVMERLYQTPGPTKSADVKYVGHGTWKATIYNVNGMPVAWKNIPEKPGAPGGWHHGEYPVGTWEVLA